MNVLKSQIKVFLLVGISLLSNNVNSFQSETTNKKPIKIGVLAKRGQEISFKKWEPTAQYLSSEIEEATFEIIPLRFDEIIEAVKKSKIDFILANPSYYVEVEYDYGVSRILTMRNLLKGKHYTQFGGVIFYNKNKNSINTINEIKGKSIMAVDEQSFGGWRVSLQTLLENGINPKIDCKSIQFAGTHDSVVYAIKNGIADIGCVRTEILEKMDIAGKINIDDFGIVNGNYKKDYEVPFIYSTKLFPEWPLAKLPHISEEFAKSVAIALLKLEENSFAIKAAGISGWTVPRNYQPVHDCLKYLKLGPYKNFGKIILSDVLYKYRIWILVLFTLILFLVISILYVSKLNKKLFLSKGKLDVELNDRVKAERALEKVNENLELLVSERTSQLAETNTALLKEIEEHKLAQSALSTEKEFSDRIIENSTAVIIGLNKDHLIKIFNKGAEIVTGYSKDEVLGKDWFKTFFSEKIVAEMLTVWPDAWGSVSHIYENSILTKSKNERFISWQTTGFYDDKDIEKHLFLSIGEDITKNKETEEALRKSEERYSSLSNLSYEGIVIHKDGIVIDTNDTLLKMVGYTSEELIGKNIIELLVPRKFHKQIFEAMQKNISVPYEIEGIGKDGTRAFLELESRDIDFGNNEKGVRVTAVRDISRRKKSELEILKFLNAVEQSSVSILITNKDGIIEYVNPKLIELSGYEKEDMIGQNPSILNSNYHPIEFFEELWNTILAGKVWTGEIYNKRKNGELYWEAAVISPIKDKDGVITHFVAVKEDVTEKKKMIVELMLSKESAEKADRLKSTFLAQMSHEIRTPINALVSMASLLRYDFEEKASEDQLMSFDIIDRAGERIIRTIDLLLNLSEVQAGTYETNITKFDVFSNVISQIVAENKIFAKSKNIDLNLIYDAQNSELVADHYTITQIFVQLIDNAIKYTEEGEVNIKIMRNELEQLVIEINDTGVGIEEEYISQIFDPFTQEEMGYTRKYEGNGIGMALVNKYCILNSAKIEVESKKGVGSTFRIIFN